MASLEEDIQEAVAIPIIDELDDSWRGDEVVLEITKRVLEVIKKRYPEGSKAPEGMSIVDRRNPDCVKVWNECGDFLYDSRCCRFPKSCSAGDILIVESDS